MFEAEAMFPLLNSVDERIVPCKLCYINQEVYH